MSPKRYWEDIHWPHLYRGYFKYDQRWLVVLEQFRNGKWQEPRNYSIALLDDLVEISKEEFVKRILKQ